MNLITLENISKNYSEKVLLNNVSLGINEGDKIGLIGINGAGKSTFLKIIAGKDEFFDGTRTKGKNVRIEFLSQDTKYNEDSTVLEQVFKGETRDMRLLMEYEDILDRVERGETLLSDKLIKLQSEIDTLNLWTLESEAKSILNKLGIKNYHEKMGNLSGGQRKRVFLASALITPCEVLILDEPTNHLDSNSIEWLEEYLNSRKGSLIMITHDRYFLDRVSNRIVEIDRGHLYSYPGNYTKFLEKKMERIETEKTQELKRQSLLRNELKWIRRGAKARTTKQKARIQRFEELSSIEYKENNSEIEIEYIGSRIGKKTIELDNISKSFNGKSIIKDFSYIFNKEDRIGIVGENGAGKSTLLNLITYKLELDSGKIEKGDTIKIGFFTQEGYELDNSIRVIDYVKEGGEYIPTNNGDHITASTLCERFLFDGTMQYTYIEKLSGGEKRRLQLLRVLMENPNFLILDEPTNDLDIETLKILENFIDSFNGIVVTVSHDRYFLDRICNKIFYLNNGKIEIMHGNYSDVKDKIILNETNNLSNVKENVKTPKAKVRNKVNERPKFSFKEQREYDEIDSIISNLEEELSQLEIEIEKNSTNYSLLQELVDKKEEVEMILLEKYERAEYLNDIASKIEEYKNSKNRI